MALKKRQRPKRGTIKRRRRWRFHEFFAGAGMVRAGLGRGWQCTFANDIDENKCRVYAKNWGDEEIHKADISTIALRQLGQRADLAWASFPCQDLSLAGPYHGLDGDRSGAFWDFWKLIEALGPQRKTPRAIVLENVFGIVSSHEGNDFRRIVTRIARMGYLVGALVIDARHFVPQSRKRVFIVAFDKRLKIPKSLIQAVPNPMWHPKSLVSAVQHLPSRALESWRWWNFKADVGTPAPLHRLIDDRLRDVEWHTASDTKRLLSMMVPTHRRRLSQQKRQFRNSVGTVFKRMRPDIYGQYAQRAEINFAGIAGCLRTPAGGSSLQTIVRIKSGTVRSRLISPRESARLMGLPDSFFLPELAVDAYRVTGDGVVVPVVRQLAKKLLEPVLKANTR